MGNDKGKDNAVIQINSDTEEAPETELETRLLDPNKAPAAALPKSLKSSALREDEDEEGEEQQEEEDEDEEEEDIIGKMKTILIVFELILFVSIIGLLISSLTVNKLKNHVIWDLELWKWCVLALVILCGRVASQWFINIIVFLIEKNFLLKHLVLYFVYGLRTSISVFIWLTLVLLVWILLFDYGYGVKRSSRATSKILHHIITRTLACFLAGAALWLVKTFSVKLIGVSFQCKRFFDRIHDSIFHQHVVQVLSTPKKKMDKKFRNINTAMQFIFTIRDVKKVKRMTEEKISTCSLKALIRFISGSKLSMSNELDDQDDIKSVSEAKHLADKIIANIGSDPQSEFIEKDRLLEFLQNERHVKYMLKLFIKVYKDRETLKRSLNDAKTAIEELNRILSAIVIVVIIIVWLLVMGLLTYKIIALVTSQLVLLAFMFGNTARTCFEAIIFVFVTHPFDVGDRCIIDGVQMVVDEMNILTTIFLRYDNERIYYPNSVLATKPIGNFFRSPPEMGDSVEFAIDVFTYLERKHKHWSKDHILVVKEIENVNKMEMALYVTHTINFQDYAKKVKRRSKLVLELKKIFEDLGIRYYLLPQEVRIRYTGPLPS
ncbi:hypothetical protein WN943_023667 [Citrus x changshan-huyou]